MNGTKASGIIISVVIALAIGGGIGYAMGNSKDDQPKDMTNNTSMEAKGGDGVTVGGAKMVSNKDIVDNAANAKNVTTVVELVQKAGLVDTLKSSGPFTVFAPSNDAFKAVPSDLLDKVAGNDELLKTVLTYHVVPGTYTTADLRAMAVKGESLTTVQGGMLMVKAMNDGVVLVDAAGQQIMIETPDVISSNGITHVIKSVMLPVNPSTL